VELAARLEGESADILGFQAAMLDDPVLSEPAFEAIAAGQGADAAWTTALGSEIAGYEAAEDEYFQARAADLRDLADRVLGHLSGERGGPPIGPGSVLTADDLPPSRFLSIDWSQGGAVLLADGSPTSHVAMLARSRAVPMIVGLGPGLHDLAGEVLVDAGSGEVLVDPSPETRLLFGMRQRDDEAARAAAHALRERPAVTRDGTRVAVHLNLARPEELAGLDPAICDGIGLVRTEFLFGASGLADEEAQYGVYRQFVEWAAGRPVTIRTLDAGGDKPIAGLTPDGESNPFLGVRGVRLSLRHPQILRAQLRALARAAVHGPVKIMLPMVTVPAELEAVRHLLDAEIAALGRAGVEARRPPLGIMVEVPAAAVAVDLFDADFYSIGSNDLTQYVTASGRDIAGVADLADPLNPAVLRLVALVARHGAASGREVSLCGDAGGEAAAIGPLLRAGLRSLSVAPALVGAAKAAIAAVDLGAPLESAAA